MTTLRSPLVVLVLVSGMLVACGDVRDEGRLPTGPPQWRAVRPRESGWQAVALEARSPCRLRIVGQGFGPDEKIYSTREVPAGRRVDLEWIVREVARAATPRAKPPADAQAKGRVEARQVDFAFLYGDRVAEIIHPVTWLRPTRGWIEIRSTPPPAMLEILPFGAEVELAAAVVGDVPRSKTRITSVDGKTHVRVEAPGEEDGARLLRLLLRVQER